MHTPKIVTEDITAAKSSGYHHHHHVGDCDYVEDIDDHDDPGVTLVSVYGNLSQYVSGQDAEDTITDVDGSDCDKCCNTFTPADIFKTHILDTLHCLFCFGPGVDDLAYCLQQRLSLSFVITSYL